MESGTKFFPSAAQLRQRGCLHCGPRSGRPPTRRPAAQAPGEQPRPQTCSAAALAPGSHRDTARRAHAFTPLWGAPCHCCFQPKLSTCRTPLCHALFHKMIPIRRSEGTPLVSETAPNGTAALGPAACCRGCGAATQGTPSGGHWPRRGPDRAAAPSRGRQPGARPSTGFC